MDSLSFFTVALNAAGWIALVVGAVFYVRSTVTRQNTAETKDLADVRRERIMDLEGIIARLELRLAKVEGQMEAIQSIKAAEIAAEVARLLHKDLVKYGPPEGTPA